MPKQNTVETMDEFDDPCAMKLAYCKQISTEEYEKQTMTETEKALQALMNYLDENPHVYKKVLSKKKKQDLEDQGMMSYLKVKMMGLIHGEDSCCKVTDQECQEKLNDLTNGMARAFHYTNETRGRRTSKRLAEKRQISRCQVNKENVPTVDARSPIVPSAPLPPLPMVPSAPLPPPPPPPPLITSNVASAKSGKSQMQKSKTMCNTPTTPMRGTPLKDVNFQMDTPQSLIVPRKHARTGSLSSFASLSPIGSLRSLHLELLAVNNPMKRLKSTSNLRSPGGTPVKKRQTEAGSPSNLTSGASPGEPLYKALVRSMHEKFRNVRSPSPTTDDNSPSSFVTSPGGFTP